jgi:hypothetical protein
MHFKNSIAARRQAAKQRDFLTHFARSGNVLASAKHAGISRGIVYYWREHSPAFAARLTSAAEKAFPGTLAADTRRGESPRHSPHRARERRPL